jgi:hypothetical protein
MALFLYIEAEKFPIDILSGGGDTYRKKKLSGIIKHRN